MKHLLATAPFAWRIFAVNAVLLIVAALALTLSPAIVSFPIALTEGLVLAVGLIAILIVNLVLVRRSFEPLERLTRLMSSVDLSPGHGSRSQARRRFASWAPSSIGIRGMRPAPRDGGNERGPREYARYVADVLPSVGRHRSRPHLHRRPGLRRAFRMIARPTMGLPPTSHDVRTTVRAAVGKCRGSASPPRTRPQLNATRPLNGHETNRSARPLTASSAASGRSGQTTTTTSSTREPTIITIAPAMTRFVAHVKAAPTTNRPMPIAAATRMISALTSSAARTNGRCFGTC
jgi:hypothetical protein